MLRFLLLLAISTGIFADSIKLSDFVFIVQKKDHVNFVFSSAVPQNIMVDFPSDYSKSSYMPLLRSMLSANNLTMAENEGIWLISPISKEGALLPPPPLNAPMPPLSVPPPPLNTPITPIIDYKLTFVSHKLDFLQFDDVKSLLEFSGLPYSFSAVSKTITFKKDDKNGKFINNVIKEIKSIDVEKKQVTLKITLFSNDMDKIKETGIDTSLNLDFNLLSQTGALLTGDAVGAFKGSLKLLSENGASHIEQATSYLIADSEKLDFKKVVTIPFLDEDFALSNQTGTNQTKKYKYKPIGFKVLASPTIVGDTVYLDFALSVETVVSAGDLPTTSENSISNKFSVKKGDIVLLAGISKTSLIEDKKGLPFFEDVNFLEKIFTHKSNTKKTETFNVSIEIL